MKYLFAFVLLAASCFAQTKLKPPAGMATVFSNLGTNLESAYNPNEGYVIQGPDNENGNFEDWVGVTFTPSQNYTLGEVALGVTWFTGTNEALLAVYDAVTMEPISSTVKLENLPVFGTCCTLTYAKLPPMSVTAGHEYFIGVRTNDTAAPDFVGYFNASNLANYVSNQEHGGWQIETARWPACAVFGTVAQ